jgi:GntR family transcriptional regulator, rspAB operon transcriptional repressor
VSARAASASLAYEEIKRRILDCKYAPGAKLSEARLADELGFGRSPVRTAFSRLQAEGWIEVNPQSGTYVRMPTEREIHDIFETRLLLETHVTRTAARSMDPGDLRELRAEFRRLAPRANLSGARAVDAFNRLDSLFHGAIYRAAGNALVTSILLNLLEKARWLKNAFPSPPKRWKQAFGEIERVLECLEAHDAEGAARLMREHIGNAADVAEVERRRLASGGKRRAPATKTS